LTIEGENEFVNLPVGGGYQFVVLDEQLNESLENFDKS
jgi:hypothetical protein